MNIKVYHFKRKDIVNVGIVRYCFFSPPVFMEIFRNNLYFKISFSSGQTACLKNRQKIVQNKFKLNLKNQAFYVSKLN